MGNEGKRVVMEEGHPREAGSLCKQAPLMERAHLASDYLKAQTDIVNPGNPLMYFNVAKAKEYGELIWEMALALVASEKENSDLRNELALIQADVRFALERSQKQKISRTNERRICKCGADFSRIGSYCKCTKPEDYEVSEEAVEQVRKALAERQEGEG